MLNPFTLTAVSLLTASVPVFNVDHLFEKYGPPKQPPFVIIQEEPSIPINKDLATKEVKEKRLICKGCSENEKLTLAFLQDKGIKDKHALATIMGNIKQESTFVPNVCEGGSRTSYTGCGGGYGLIQWTSAGRYFGLGKHAQTLGKDPSSIHAQLSYMLTETQWKKIENRMKTPGKSIDRYMDYAYDWIGWGHHGARTSYARDYARKISTES